MKIVNESDAVAKDNAEKYGDNFFTVLFFDEANTTEAITFIKEIVCDGTMNGQPLNITKNLKFIAACNPYRKYAITFYSVLNVFNEYTTSTLLCRHLIEICHSVAYTDIPPRVNVVYHGYLNQVI